MSTAQIAAAPAPAAGTRNASALLPAASSRWPALPMLGTYLFVLWGTFITADPISLGPIPFKLVLLAMALGLWLAHRSGRPIPFAAGVIVVAVGMPIVWSIVALFYAHPYAGAQPSPTHMTLEQASRFLYLLIYLPIADYMLHASARRAVAMWAVPVFGLVGLTWLLYVLYHQLGVSLPVELPGNGRDAAKLGPLLGIVTPPGVEPVRIFFANHILLIPMLAVALGWLVVAERRRWSALAVVLVSLAVLYPIHSRGLTIGVLAVVTITAGLSWRTQSLWPAALLVVSITVLLSTGFDTRAAQFLTGDRSDASTQDRVAQAPQLLDGFQLHPIMGSGLGATLPSGFARSPSEPYQFELTYLQILFQNGIVGLALIVGLPLLVCLRCVLVLGMLERRERAMAVAGVAALASMLLAGATNPYLISSYGMLAAAVALALCARGLDLARQPRAPTPNF